MDDHRALTGEVEFIGWTTESHLSIDSIFIFRAMLLCALYPHVLVGGVLNKCSEQQWYDEGKCFNSGHVGDNECRATLHWKQACVWRLPNVQLC